MTHQEALDYINTFAFLAISDATSLVDKIYEYFEDTECDLRIIIDKYTEQVSIYKGALDRANQRIKELEAYSKKEVQTIKKGQLFVTPNHGRVVFEGLDFYSGECTAKLRGIDHSGTYYPKLETLSEFQFIDN